MEYNFGNLDATNFEDLVQSLTQKLLGSDSLVFGSGADGARELTYFGKSHFPNPSAGWDGYWVVQAKYKSKKFDTGDDFSWVQKNFIQEMNKFKSKRRNLKIPNNYIFFTNAVLTPVHEKGGKDKMQEVVDSYKHLIPNILICSYDELCKFLDNNRDVATAYSSFILSGDILIKLFELLEYKGENGSRVRERILSHTEKTFNSELYSKLIQAGDLVNQINIEKVFIDIDVTQSTSPTERIKFLEFLIKEGNKSFRSRGAKKIVLVGGAGSGKSTLSQFASQIYSAFFVSDNQDYNAGETIKQFIQDFDICERPSCLRFPFKIVLKDYASWVKDQIAKDESPSVLQFIKYRIGIFGDGYIELDDLRKFLGSISLLFIFDGLDEVPITSNREEVLFEINHFIDIELKNCIADSLILCTTRQQGYVKEFDENRYQHYYVSELTNEDCEIYLHKLLENIEPSYDEKQNYLRTLKEAISDETTSRLMRTPLQATIMAILVKSGGKPSRNKYNLFKEYYDTIYRRELQKELLPILKDKKRNIDYIHDVLGFKLQTLSEGSDNPSSLMDSESFQFLIRQYLQVKEGWSDQEITDFLNVITKAVTERLVFISELQDSKIGFVIRSLQEYFAANYLINHNDSTLIDNLKNISYSSYWRNTFLFAVSGVHNNKHYLIDQIYLHLEFLNGNEESPAEMSVKKIQRYGTQLALDVLSEGIFSDNPKNKNRFGNLLKLLFTSPSVIDAHKIEQLPIDFTRDVVIDKFVRDCLKSDVPFVEKYSAYQLSCVLIQNDNFTNLIAECLLDFWDGKNDVEILKLMCDVNAIQNQVFINKAKEALKKENYFDYSFLVEIDFDAVISPFSVLLKNHLKDEEVVSRLIEMHFLYALGEPINRSVDAIFENYQQLTKKRFKTSGSSDWGILMFDTFSEKFEVSEGYSISVGKIKGQNINLSCFKSIFDKYSIAYLSQYVSFLMNPTKDGFIKFWELVRKTNSKTIYESLIFTSRTWIFRKLSYEFSDFSHIDELISHISSDEFGDYKDWLSYENSTFENSDYNELFKLSTLSHRSSSKPIIEDFYLTFENELSLSDNKFIRAQFIKIFVNSFDPSLTPVEYTLPSNLNDRILEIMNNDLQEILDWKDYFVRLSILIFIYFNDSREIEKIDNKLFNYFRFNNLEKIGYYPAEANQEVLKKCVNYYNLQSFSDKQIMEYLLLFLVMSSDERGAECLQELNLPYNKIAAMTYPAILFGVLTSKLKNYDVRDIVSQIETFNSDPKASIILTQCLLDNKQIDSTVETLLVTLYEVESGKQNPSINTLSNIQLGLRQYKENEYTAMASLDLGF